MTIKKDFKDFAREQHKLFMKKELDKLFKNRKNEQGIFKDVKEMLK